MKSLILILNTLTTDEQREFILWLRKKNKRNDVKNVAFVQLLLKGTTKGIAEKLYGKGSKNAFHALCKRVHDSLIDFLAINGFSGETSEEYEILKLLLAGRILLEQEEFTIGYTILTKAEQKALALDLYPILSEIYQTKIQYAHTSPTVNLDNLIKASQINMSYLEQEIRLNMAFAVIKQQLENSPSKEEINDIIKTVFSKFNVNGEHALSFKSLFQLISITATAAKLQSNYYIVTTYMMKLYNAIADKKALAEKQRYYHLEILNLLAISNFRNKDFSRAQEFATVMKQEMSLGKRVYKNIFWDKYTSVHTLLLNFTGKPEEALRELSAYTGNSLTVSIIKVMCHFQQEQFSEAYTIVKNMSHSDTWYEKKEGWLWVLKKNILEILLLIELNKLDVGLSRIQSFKRKYTVKLQQIQEERVLVFINLVDAIYASPEIVQTPKFKDKVERSFTWVGREREDVLIMSFYAWLKAKMENKNLYEVTMDLVTVI